MTGPDVPADESEFVLIDSEDEIEDMAVVVDEGISPARDGVVVNGAREFELSFEVELDPRFVDAVFDVDTHPMGREWRRANR